MSRKCSDISVHNILERSGGLTMVSDALNNDEGARAISQISTNNDTQTRRTAVAGLVVTAFFFCLVHITDGSVSQ